MDVKVSAEKFVDELLSDEAHERPSDNVKAEGLQMELPEWFEEEKFNQGRRFFNDFRFPLSASMVLGLVAVFAVPSILNILIGTRRSNSVYTAYKRYLSTHAHVTTWFDNELKPGSVSWRSLHTVRTRHVQASRAASLKGQGIVSQRDLALTLFGFIGFSFLKPNKFAITQLRKGDWEAYNFSWRTFAYMIGLEDRYNICRDTYEETCEVCKLILKRVFTPCLENVPEYFYHMTDVMVNGTSNILSLIDISSVMFATKYLAEVPGYIYTEEDRLKLIEKLKKELNGQPLDTGVDAGKLIEKCAIGGLPTRKPNLMYLSDYETVESSPAYKAITTVGKYKLALNSFLLAILSTYVGRIALNLYFKWVMFLALYFPYSAMWNFGIKNAFVNIFKEDPADDTVPKQNSEYIKNKPSEPWYKVIYGLLW